MDELRETYGGTQQSIFDSDANRDEDLELRVENFIGAPELDYPIRKAELRTTLSGYRILVLDPGKTVGWAGLCFGRIEVGQAPWYKCLDFAAEQVVIERTPFAAQRTFDVWPLYYTGAVIAKMYPREPEYVLPTSLKIAQRWYKLPPGHGLGPHAKDALTHLVWVLGKELSV
jgi:hypothetical protein